MGICVFGIFMGALSTEVASFEGFGIERSVPKTWGYHCPYHCPFGQ